MISSKVYKIVGTVIWVASHLASIPFGWDFKKKKVDASKWAEWPSQFFFFMLYIPYMFLMTIKVIYYQLSRDYSSLAYLYGLWNFAVMIFILALLQVTNANELRVLCNAVVTYTENLSAFYTRRHEGTQNKIRRLKQLLIIIILVSTLSQTVAITHHCLFPTDVAYPWSIMSEDDFTLPIYLFLVNSYAVGQTIVGTLMNLQMTAIVAYIYTLTVIILPEFTTGRPSTSYGISGKLRTFQRLPQFYRGLQILHSRALNLYGWMMIPFQTLCLNQVLFCNYILTTRWKEMEDLHKALLLLWSVMITIIYGGVLEYGGRLFQVGTKTLRSWEHFNWGTNWRNKYMKRFGKACRPIRIHYGNRYTIRKLTVLKFFRGIVRGTFRALLVT
ncbi:unnamed protein product [Orchesella dallaii]|uniref:Odorant receptor n=1 Tax=Orchesella dallaii TaxID=48710 RepID=A0ABP1RV12_9HEXA